MIIIIIIVINAIGRAPRQSGRSGRLPVSGPPPAFVGAGKKGGEEMNPRFIIFLKFPCAKLRLLVWDSGLQLIYEHRGKNIGSIQTAGIY